MSDFIIQNNFGIGGKTLVYYWSCSIKHTFELSLCDKLSVLVKCDVLDSVEYEWL